MFKRRSVYAALLMVAATACSTEPQLRITPGVYSLVTANDRPLPATIDSIDGGSYHAIKQWVAGSIEVHSDTEGRISAEFEGFLLVDGVPTNSGSYSFSRPAQLDVAGNRLLVSYEAAYQQLCGGSSTPIPITDTVEITGHTLTTTRWIRACFEPVLLRYELSTGP